MPERADFDELYRRDPDPFAVASAWYERRKLAVVLASLAEPRYALAWDCACGTGELAASLADRCDTVVASDASAEAIRLATARTASAASVRCVVNRLPSLPELPERPELVVVSEVLYYLDATQRSASCAALAATAAAEIVCVNWRHHPHDAYLSGDEAVAELGQVLATRAWAQTVRHDDVDFVLAAWRPATDPS